MSVSKGKTVFCRSGERHL